MSQKNYKILLNNVRAFVFDIDGVMTNGKVLITTDGEALREINTRDGYALKHASRKGFKIGVISGGKNQSVKRRLELVGVNKVYMGRHTRHNCNEKGWCGNLPTRRCFRY